MATLRFDLVFLGDRFHRSGAGLYWRLDEFRSDQRISLYLDERAFHGNQPRDVCERKIEKLTDQRINENGKKEVGYRYHDFFNYCNRGCNFY
jgi:hypothetical protein